MDILFLFTLLSTIYCLIYVYFKTEFQHWSKKNVPTLPPTFPFGNITKVVRRIQPISTVLCDLYNEMKRRGYRYAGIYLFSRKGLLIIDPELAKAVLQTNFNSFSDRGLYYNEESDPMSANLITLNGEKWRKLRTKLTPVFSSGKLKSMFPVMNSCTEQLIEALTKEDLVEIKDFISRYTIDVIGTCAFGIDCNTMKYPDNEFRRYGKLMFQETKLEFFKRLFLRSFPAIGTKLKLKTLNEKVANFFMNLTFNTIRYREQNRIERPDFIQLLMELIQRENEQDIQEPFSMTQAAAQGFVFFLAGFETSASTLSFAIYELARNIDIQNKLRTDILQNLKKHNNIFDYNSINDMTYLDKVIQETLRKWPTVPFFIRNTVETCYLPGTDVIVDKGTTVFVSAYAIHHDPEYYPNPEKFDPDRFNTDLVKSRNDYTYLPFGNGHRICIGVRFAMLELKIAIATMLQHFEFTLNEKTDDPLVMDLTPILLNPVGGIWINIKKISKET